MKTVSGFRKALVAAVPLTLLASTSLAVNAAQADLAPHKIEMMADEADKPVLQKLVEEHPVGKTVGILALLAAGLAGLSRFLPTETIKKAAGAVVPATAKLARTVASAPLAAGRAIGGKLGAPLRKTLWIVSLASVGFLGIGFFDLEWLAGLLLGAAIVGLFVFRKKKRRVKRV